MDNKEQHYPVVFGVLLVAISVLVAVLFSGCIENSSETKNPFLTGYQSFYSFEEGMQGWQVNGTDLFGPPINWSVNRSDMLASDGSYAMRFYLENFNDAGKIWIERSFEVEPNTLYMVSVSYQFATADFGDFNLFNLITTVSGDGFSGRDDLNYEGDTGHHSDAEGFVWLDKSFEYMVKTDENGSLYVNIGVWGSWETTRTYYVDAVNITVQELEVAADYPSLGGTWSVQYFDSEGSPTNQENVTLIQDGSLVILQFNFATASQGYIVKNTEENPFRDSEFVIKGVDFRGLGIDTIYIIDENSMITEMPMCETCNPAEFSR